MQIIDDDTVRFNECLARSDSLWIQFTTMVSNYLNWDLDVTSVPSKRLNADGDLINAGYESDAFSKGELFEYRKEIFADTLAEYKHFMEKIHKKYTRLTKKYSIDELIPDRSKHFSGLSDDEIKEKIDQCFLYYEQKVAEELNN